MRLSVVFALASALAACTGSGSSTPEETELQTQQAKFQTNMSDSYMFDTRRECECTTETTREMRVTVTNGTISSAYYLDDQTAVSAQVLEHVMTIEETFEEIQSAIDDDAHVINVEYDTELGFPKSVSIDYSAQIADEELSLNIRNVQTLVETCGRRPCG